MVTKQPRKQRKALYNAPHHVRMKFFSTHLSDELKENYGRRSLPVRTGDIVRVMRGKYRGHEGKVVGVNRKKLHVYIEGVTHTKVDGKQVQMGVHPSNLLLVKPDTSDPLRRKKIGLGEEVSEVE